MGQAKKRKEELGDLYGTPEGSNLRGKVVTLLTDPDSLANYCLGILSSADQIEFCRLLESGPASFSHSFDSVDPTISKVVLSANGEACSVELCPLIGKAPAPSPA